MVIFYITMNIFLSHEIRKANKQGSRKIKNQLNRNSIFKSIRILVLYGQNPH